MDNPRSARNLLVIDDDPTILEYLRRALGARGYSVATADSVDHAFDLLSSPTMRVDMIICDVVMPRRDGFALHDALNSLLNPIPVIFITGAPAKIIEAQLRRPPVSILPKPIELDVLDQAIQRALA